jgi:hypothetical protein
MFHSCKCAAFPLIPTIGNPTLNRHSLFRLSENILCYTIRELKNRYALREGGNRKLCSLRRHVSWPVLQYALNSLFWSFGWQIRISNETMSDSFRMVLYTIAGKLCMLFIWTYDMQYFIDWFIKERFIVSVSNDHVTWYFSKENCCFNLYTENKLPQVWRLYDIHLSINNIPITINNVWLLSVIPF